MKTQMVNKGGLAFQSAARHAKMKGFKVEFWGKNELYIQQYFHILLVHARID